MIITRNTMAARTSAVVAAVVVVVLVAFAGAQTKFAAAESNLTAHANRALAAQARAEVTVSGTVDRLLSQPESAVAPMGTHLLLRVSGGSVDAHLGPFSSRQSAETLAVGEEVEATGVWTNIGGREVLLVRQLRVGDRVVIVRNERGFLVRESSARRHERAARSAIDGGAQ